MAPSREILVAESCVFSNVDNVYDFPVPGDLRNLTVPVLRCISSGINLGKNRSAGTRGNETIYELKGSSGINETSVCPRDKSVRLVASWLRHFPSKSLHNLHNAKCHPLLEIFSPLPMTSLDTTSSQIGEYLLRGSPLTLQILIVKDGHS